MYKVFVNDCPLILTDAKNVSTGFYIENFENVNVLEIVESLFQGELEGIQLYCNDLKKCWREFKSNFKKQKAAGGKVINTSNEVLFIYRLTNGIYLKVNWKRVNQLKNVQLEKLKKNVELIIY